MSADVRTAAATAAVRYAVPPIDDRAMAHWDQSASVATLSGATMGTRWQVRYAEPENHDPAQLSEEIQGLFATIIADMSHWVAESRLCVINRSPPGEWHSVSADFADVLGTALEVAAVSGGAFDPAIGALVDLWGYGPVAVDRAPMMQEIAAAREGGGWQQLDLDRGACRVRRRGTARLDLSGIAKGHAVDRLSKLLQQNEIFHSLVEIGGEFVGRGLRPDGDPWWVELETPGACAAPIRVALHQCAAATSGDYIRGRHTIDPRTGSPVAHALAVSVIHETAMQADAWATALSVVAPAEMMAMAAARHLRVRALIRREGRIVEWLSPELRAMIDD